MIPTAGIFPLRFGASWTLSGVRETHFIPNGVNRPQIREAKLITDNFGLEKDSYILFLGRLVPEKGIRYLVEAFKNVKTDKKLVIAGGSSDTDSFMEELKELAKGDDRILFTGFVQGAMLDELYSNAYIYTLPSDLEGMPLSLLEAMSYGNCCLVSDIPECAEVVEDKDLSRFGRNYIEVGRYLERIFPVMRVRLIAVTDNYDSQSAWKTSDSIMVPMRNLLNDAYCRDISVKIKSQLAVKRKRGDFVGSFAAYGYQKDPSNHTKLIVDELAAETVQDIFRWKISGMNNQSMI